MSDTQTDPSVTDPPTDLLTDPLTDPITNTPVTTDTPSGSKPHIAHCWFRGYNPIYRGFKQGSRCNRIVTVAWSYETFHLKTFTDEKSDEPIRTKTILKYGATVFRKTKSNDLWLKKLHTHRAITRHNNSPVCVEFDGDLSDVKPCVINWYIAQKLIFKYKTYDTTGTNTGETSGTSGNTTETTTKIHGPIHIREISSLYCPCYVYEESDDYDHSDDYDEMDYDQLDYDDLNDLGCNPYLYVCLFSGMVVLSILSNVV